MEGFCLAAVGSLAGLALVDVEGAGELVDVVAELGRQVEEGRRLVGVGCWHCCVDSLLVACVCFGGVSRLSF